MPMASTVGGRGTGAWRRTVSTGYRSAAPPAASPARASPSAPRANNAAISPGKPTDGSVRSTTSSPARRPGRGAAPGSDRGEKLSRRTRSSLRPARDARGERLERSRPPRGAHLAPAPRMLGDVVGLGPEVGLDSVEVGPNGLDLFGIVLNQLPQGVGGLPELGPGQLEGDA